MGVTQNSYIPRAWEVSDLKVLGATRPRLLNQILPSHLVYNYPARACASKGLCDRSWRLYIVVFVYCILYISLHFFLEPIFYLPKYSLSEVYFNRDRLLIEFNGLWYSLAARQVFAAIANPDSLSFG